MEKIKSFLGALIFLSMGAFLGFSISTATNSFDVFKKDRLEMSTGKAYYTSYECKILFEENVLKYDQTGGVEISEEEKETFSKKDDRIHERFREHIQENYGN